MNSLTTMAGDGGCRSAPAGTRPSVNANAPKAWRARLRVTTAVSSPCSALTSISWPGLYAPLHSVSRGAGSAPAAVGPASHGLRCERAGRAIDRLDQLHAAPALVAVAGRPRPRLDRPQEVLDQPLVAAGIADDRRRSARVGISPAAPQLGARRAQVGGDDAGVREDHAALRPRDLDTARVAGVRRRAGLEDAGGAAREL